MAVEVILTMASVGYWMVGSGTSSTRTSRLPCQVTAFMVKLLSSKLIREAGSNGGRRCPAHGSDAAGPLHPVVVQYPATCAGNGTDRVSPAVVRATGTCVTECQPAARTRITMRNGGPLDGRRTHPAAGRDHHRRVQWDRPVDRPRPQRPGLECGAGLPFGDRAGRCRAGMRRFRHRNAGSANRCGRRPGRRRAVRQRP